MSYTTIKLPQTSSKFGKIDKIIWFKVDDINGIFNLNLFITPNQTQNTNITIFNNGTKEEKFKKVYSRSSNGTTISEIIKINHVKGLNSIIYGIKTN